MMRTRIIASRALGLSWNRASHGVHFASAHAQSGVRLLSTRQRRRILGQTGTPHQTDDGRGESDDRTAVNRPVKVTDMQQFVEAAQDFLERIEKSLEPMKKHNYMFIVDREANSLKLTVADGVYAFEVDEDSHSIMLQSPVSGQFTYVLCASTGQWVNDLDGHMVEGMFVRDLIRHCNGVPNL
jgi:frataxin-like iron-binding protein CyaY